jgi:Raf kinase inhibitor-like YbhB/YbcL family protein
MAFNITSTAFEHGAMIPAVHTCDGDNVSPPLRWDEAPKATASFALVMEDTDAPGGIFTHWIMYNIPPDAAHLEKIIPIKKNLKNKAIQGKNDFGKIGYRGPCPPKGGEHRYFFRVFALKKKLPPESANTRDDFYRAIKDLVLEEAEYMGRYKKKPVNVTTLEE